MKQLSLGWGTSTAKGRGRGYCGPPVERVRVACAYCSAPLKRLACKLQNTRTGRFFCSKQCQHAGQYKRALTRTHNGKPARLHPMGYVMVWEPAHPKAVNGGWVLEHRYVVEQHLGRHLRADEVVHHRNEIKDDNRLENLEVMSQVEHRRLHSLQDVATARSNAARVAELEQQIATQREQIAWLQEALAAADARASVERDGVAPDRSVTTGAPSVFALAARQHPLLGADWMIAWLAQLRRDERQNGARHA